MPLFTGTIFNLYIYIIYTYIYIYIFLQGPFAPLVLSMFELFCFNGFVNLCFNGVYLGLTDTNLPGLKNRRSMSPMYPLGKLVFGDGSVFAKYIGLDLQKGTPLGVQKVMESEHKTEGV